MLQFLKEFSCQIKWIYLESGHGKGVPDGIGAVVNCAIQNLIAYNPSIPIYTVKDLMTVGLQGHLPSVKPFQYSSEDVAGLNIKIPSIICSSRTIKTPWIPYKEGRRGSILFVKNLSNEESRKAPLNLLQITNDHTEESEEEQDEKPDASNRNDSGESDYDSDINESNILFILFIII